jgi:hypothetical protein
MSFIIARAELAEARATPPDAATGTPAHDMPEAPSSG